MTTDPHPALTECNSCGLNRLHCEAELYWEDEPCCKGCSHEWPEEEK